MNTVKITALGEETSPTVTSRWRGRLVGALAWAAAAAVLVGCPATQFVKEPPGQVSARSEGTAPAGSIGACRVPSSKRPPVVNKALWDTLRPCTSRTPGRYLRLGYGAGDDQPAEVAQKRVDTIMGVLRQGRAEGNGNVRMNGMLRTVRRQAVDDIKLTARVERASGRTFACDYTYLLNHTDKEYAKLAAGDKCPAYAFDPKDKKDQCLFDTRVSAATWLTSAWSCMAFTETVGEGGSCYRLCAYDDFCAGQVNCAAADFDLVLCALGVCLPEQTAGFY